MIKRLFFILAIILFVSIVGAQTNTVCCEKTKSGAFCQDVPIEECAEGSQQVPTSCESTSYCKPGTCYDSNEGICLDNTPQIVCNENEGIWSEESPQQCELGCCILGDQAAFVTLVRCKQLSSYLGLETNYDTSIKDELSCIQTVQQQDKGACVYEFEFERTCKFSTRSECQKGVNGTNSGIGSFYEGRLCSAEELGTNCGPSTKTTCLSGKDEVYFVDTCGNPANIYDASKINDKDYWTNVKTKAESCNSESGNENNPNCGNCNYLLGSFCRGEDAANSNAAYGDFVCADLNCIDSEGRNRLHGESWCVGNAGNKGEGINDVGDRFFRQICVNGEVITEACADFKNEECIEDSIETSAGEFSQAACRVNRWQDCLAQTKREDCENRDRRDCFWEEGAELGPLGNTTEGEEGICLPLNPPGLNFWDSDESLGICSQANLQCVVKFEKGLFGGEECIDNCECLTEEWERLHADVCAALGDCGPKLNWVNKEGYKEGFEVVRSDQ